KVRQSKERGYPEGQTPPKDPATPKDPPKETNPKDPPKDPPKETKPDDPDKAEQDAARKLKAAKSLIDDGLKEKAIERLEELIKAYPKTKAAEEAKKELDKLNK